MDLIVGVMCRLAYYVMSKWTRVAASETHELCLDHHVHGSPNSTPRRLAIPINLSSISHLCPSFTAAVTLKSEASRSPRVL